VQKSDSLYVLETPRGIEPTPYGPEFARQMDLAEAVMREDRDALRKGEGFLQVYREATEAFPVRAVAKQSFDAEKGSIVPAIHLLDGFRRKSIQWGQRADDYSHHRRGIRVGNSRAADEPTISTV
jgi:hypothetical protein